MQPHQYLLKTVSALLLVTTRGSIEMYMPILFIVIMNKLKGTSREVHGTWLHTECN